MNKKLFYKCAFLLTICSGSLQAQTQIGSDIIGKKAGDLAGNTVSLSANGKILAVGSPEFDTSGSNNRGQVILYENKEGVWTQIGNELIGEANSDKFGISIDLSNDGTIVAIGSSANRGITGDINGIGHVRVYKNIDNVWTQIGTDIDGVAKGDNSGSSVSISADGTVVAIGSPNSTNTNGTNAGMVRVFRNTSGTWTQVGENILGESKYQMCGNSVSLSADGATVVIASRFAGPSEKGNVRIFKNSNDTWTQVGKTIIGKDGDWQSGFCISMSADGNTIALSSPYNDQTETSLFKAGRVRVFHKIGENWVQLGPDFEADTASGLMGYSLSISANGRVLAMAAPWNSENGSNSGKISIFNYVNDTWNPCGNYIYGKGVNSYNGYSISLSADGKTLAVGSPWSNVNTTNIGYASVYDISEIISEDDSEIVIPETLSSDKFVFENFTVYPNPVKNDLFINLNSDLNLKEVNVFSTTGQLIKTEKANQINMSTLSKGFYFIQVITEQGNATKKIFVE
ncbi:MAG: T9SS type A sorting domain-containing protein [Flavobacterium sp.]